MNTIEIATHSDSNRYKIQVNCNNLLALGAFARQCLPAQTARICLISNRRVFNIYGEKTLASLRAANFQTAVFLMPDGEKHKNLRVLEKALLFFSENKLTRADAVAALGGGVVGDLAGFAAAIFNRGLPFLQIPTTLLAQIDSSVGGKTGVNTAFGKNLVGAFHQPHGVSVDVLTLKTLAHREVIAGFCEAIKQGAVGDQKLFVQTRKFLESFPLKNFPHYFDKNEKNNFLADLQSLILAQIAFKADIVAGDERENVDRTDSKSRRILNFGHTVGHALERATNYKRFKHGEAVGLGVQVAAEISNRLGKLPKNELNLLRETVRMAGRLPKADDLAPETIRAAFSSDKKAVGNSFKWILLKSIGHAEIIDNQDIPINIVHDALRVVLQN